MFKKLLLITLMLGFIFINPVFAESTVANDTGDVESITLSGEGEKITWVTKGDSVAGFKVVWSKNENPVYPLRDGDKYNYYTDSKKDFDIITNFDGDGTYYVRVCEYLDGKCGVYSNEIKVELKAEEDAVACTLEYVPVCTKSGNTYSNKCMANANNEIVSYEGKCKETVTVEKKIVCDEEYEPVCTTIGETHRNECVAVEIYGQKIDYFGECKNIKDEEKYYSKIEFKCTNNKEYILGEESSCKGIETWTEYAKEDCVNNEDKLDLIDRIPRSSAAGLCVASRQYDII